MSIDALKARLPEAFRDARLNLSALASEEVLAEPTKWGLLFACAIATRNAEVRDAFAAEAAARLPEEVQQAARAAATVMAMNNVYYRAVHLASNNGIREDAGAAADERHRQSRRAEARFRALVPGGVGDQRLRRLHRLARESAARRRRSRRADPRRVALRRDRPVDRGGARSGGDGAGGAA